MNGDQAKCLSDTMIGGKSDLPEFNTNQCYTGLPDKRIVCITNLERHCSGVELHGIKLGFCHPSLTFFVFAAEFSSFNVKTIPFFNQPSCPTR